MNKIQFTSNQESQIVIDYRDHKKGLSEIGKRFGVSREVIKRLLMEYKIQLRPAVKPSTGGRQAAQKRYIEKNKEQLAEYNSEWQKENREYLNEKRRNRNEKN